MSQPYRDACASEVLPGWYWWLTGLAVATVIACLVVTELRR